MTQSDGMTHLFFVLSDHGIQDGQKFAHTGNQSHFLGFTRGL